MVMPADLPQCCSPEAFKLLTRQATTLDSPDALLGGAVAIALHQMEGIDLAAQDAQIQKYVDSVRSRVRSTLPQAILAHLHDVLFEEEGFAGNTEDYYNPNNSYLPA